MQDLLEKVRLLEIIMHLQYLRCKPMINSYSHGALDEVTTNTHKNNPGLVGQNHTQHRDLPFLLPRMVSLPPDRQPSQNEECLPVLSSCLSWSWEFLKKWFIHFKHKGWWKKNVLVTRHIWHSALAPWESNWTLPALWSSQVKQE